MYYNCQGLSSHLGVATIASSQVSQGMYIEVAFVLVDAEFIVYDDACHLQKFAGNPT